MAPLTVRAVAGRVKRATRFRLVLGVPEHGAQILFAVRELTFIAIRALDLLDVLTAHFRLVPRAQRRLRRQRLLLLLLLLLLFTGSTTTTTTALSLATSRFRRHRSLVTTTAIAAACRRHHLLPPVFHFRDNGTWLTLCLRKTKKQFDYYRVCMYKIHSMLRQNYQKNYTLKIVFVKKT